MDFVLSVLIVAGVICILHYFCGRKKKLYPDISKYMKDENTSNALLEMYGVKHVNAIVDQFHSLDQVSNAIRKAGLENSNLIFG